MLIRIKLYVASILFPLMMLVTSNAQAALATWKISANIDQVDQDLQNYFSIGDVITGSLIVEGANNGCVAIANSICAGQKFVTYKNAVQSYILNAGAHSFVGLNPSSNGVFQISNSSLSGDSFNLLLAAPASNSTDFGNVNFNNVSMFFEDTTGNALSSIELPLTPPDSSLFNKTELWLTFTRYIPAEGSTQFQFLTSSVKASNLQLHSVSSVPEPETYAMLLVGLGLMSLISRRKMRN